MKIPTDSTLGPWAKDLIQECQVSMQSRRDQARMFRQLYYTGTVTSKASKHNKCYSLLDKLQSYLFSPSEVRFSIDMEADQVELFGEIGDTAARHLNQEFARVNAGTNCGLTFSNAVGQGLIDGCCFVRPVWRNGRYFPQIIRQGFMGVLREDLSSFAEQDAFTHSQYHTKASFARLVRDHPDKEEIIARAQSAYQPADADTFGDSYFHEIISGGIAPISITGIPTGKYGNVQVFAAQPQPQLSADVASELIRVDDLWVYDDERNDWVTIRMCEPDILIEGKYRLQNIGDVPGRHPFVKVCPNEVDGYFWGRSELANVAALQEILNARINDVDDIFRLQAKPPRSFSGFSGLTDEKALALLSAGGRLTEDAPVGSKVENLAPEMPNIALDYITALERFMDEAAGFSAILSGDADPNVRAGAQAQTLVRTASPRMRDRSLTIEAQCSEFGDKCFAMSQAKNARVFRTPKGKEFLLKNLPEGTRAVVDSHTSSPAFQGDNLNLAFALFKAGALSTEELIGMTHPPDEEQLMQNAREREAAQAKMLQEHPELLDKKRSRAA